MKFIFWQNVISIHQSAFIKALAKEHDVTLVAEEEITDQRRADGWSVPNMGEAKIILNPDDAAINALLSCIDARQVFSGIDAFPMVFKAFKSAVKRGCDISVMMEPYQWQGAKGFLRRCKYAWFFKKYGNHISRIFATGDLGVRAFRKAGFPAHKLYQWGYFTEQVATDIIYENAKPKIIFVGSIDTRKNILSLVAAAGECRNLYEELLIVGGGPLEPELKNAIASNRKIHYLGRLRNQAVGELIASCDLLVLPSLFDGWGAVVNEALLQGTRVLCSDNCGASALLDGETRGGVFQLSKPESLQETLTYWLGKGALTADERKGIISWAEKNISGETAAEYFKKRMTGQAADIPWLTPPPKKKHCKEGQTR